MSACLLSGLALILAGHLIFGLPTSVVARLYLSSEVQSVRSQPFPLPLPSEGAYVAGYYGCPAMRLHGLHTSHLGITPGRTSAMPHVPEIAHPICEEQVLPTPCEAGLLHVGRKRLQAWPGPQGVLD